MGVSVLSDGDKAVFYCNTRDEAFGPVISYHDMPQNYNDLEEFAHDFLRFLHESFEDPRTMINNEIQEAFFQFYNKNEGLEDHFFVDKEE